ncbi:P-loop NTPase fold protein [uncultured Croceitalea sp.]|uniref:KAP family P-loop NTPase fold protein n=1 Tax=uncultured Croceitalea sp. TaxID=1798908 RepID=UPI00374EFCD1
MWSDNETTEDLLGFEVHAKLITEIIEDENLLPITVGVFGDWGSGKSSILKIVNEELLKSDEEGTFVLYFNGWLFEGYDDAKAALLESILKEFEENKKFGPEIKEKAKKLLKSVNWMRILGLGFKHIAIPAVSAYATGGVSLIPFLAEKFSQINPEDISELLQGDKSEEFLKSLTKEIPEEEKSMLVRKFRDDFHDLIAVSKIKKLVVIIDDLDRCTPDRIIENLEAIKLFLNVDNTAFIIGADPRIVRHAIIHRFRNGNSDSGKNDRIVEDYLEKLIQVPYYLPRLSDSEVETYITLLICKREVQKDSFKNVLKAFQEFRKKDKYRVFGLGNLKEVVDTGEYEHLTKSLGSLPALSAIITQSLYGNPRQIKRFLNTFTLRNKLAEVATITEYDRTVLAKLMILEYTELKLFKQLYDWQSAQKGTPIELKELEKICNAGSDDEKRNKIKEGDYSQWAVGKIVKWLSTEPKLEQIDLSDYFWLSRDKISSSIAGASLIPPYLKLIYNKLNQEDLPATASKNIIQNEVSTLSEDESNQFLEFSINMLRNNQETPQGYRIFHYLIEQEIMYSSESYMRLLNLIDKAKIPPAMGTDLKSFKQHPDLGSFLEEYFKNGKTKAAKAFNL